MLVTSSPHSVMMLPMMEDEPGMLVTTRNPWLAADKPGPGVGQEQLPVMGFVVAHVSFTAGVRSSD
eukprot:SAG31_NODE_3597_length_4085_cov_5.800301_3_plen_66_part_00